MMKTLILLLPILGQLGGAVFAQEPKLRQSPPYVPESIKKGEPAKPPAKGVAVVQDVKPDEADQLLKQRKEIVVLDVRTPDEFAAGHLKDAKNIDFLEGDFAKRVAEVEGRPIIVHCASGGRSTKALKVLETRNFPQIYHLKGGYKAWVEAGKPVVGAPPAAK